MAKTLRFIEYVLVDYFLKSYGWNYKTIKYKIKIKEEYNSQNIKIFLEKGICFFLLCNTNKFQNKVTKNGVLMIFTCCDLLVYINWSKQ